MGSEWKEFMVMYDVRGIQNYVFKTNKLKEVIGASGIISDLIIHLFNQAVKDAQINLITNDDIYGRGQARPLQFFHNNEEGCEVLYYGGGNLVVLFRTDEEKINKINKKISMELIRESYGLSLACAKTQVTKDYKKDYEALRNEMDHVKDNMPELKLCGALPIIATDPMTGYPLTSKARITGQSHKIKVSTETKKKIDKYNSLHEKENTKYEGNEIDLFGTESGDNLIAIIHADGNRMGKTIAEVIQNANTYEDAAQRMRTLSYRIKQTFEVEGVQAMRDVLPEAAQEAGLKDREDPIFRVIIKAGDDMTFVCNDKIALRLVETFIHSISGKKMYDEPNTPDYIPDFSACAGIAIVHKGFPFSVGYQIAEQLCDSAKARAKGLNSDEPGNFIDFQYCYSGILDDLDTIREESYKIQDNDKTINLCLRPYSLYADNEVYSLSNFKKRLATLKRENLPRSKAKELRDAYYEGPQVLESVINEILSRKHDMPKFEENGQQQYFADVNGETCATYYDALEMMDLKWEGDFSNGTDH